MKLKPADLDRIEAYCERGDSGKISDLFIFANNARKDLPLVIQSLREAYADIERLKKALEFYAGMEHLHYFDEWETVSGEPQNWLCPACDESGDRAEMVETGELARQALKETGER